MVNTKNPFCFLARKLQRKLKRVTAFLFAQKQGRQVKIAETRTKTQSCFLCKTTVITFRVSFFCLCMGVRRGRWAGKPIFVLNLISTMNARLATLTLFYLLINCKIPMIVFMQFTFKFVLEFLSIIKYRNFS